MFLHFLLCGELHAAGSKLLELLPLFLEGRSTPHAQLNPILQRVVQVITIKKSVMSIKSAIKEAVGMEGGQQHEDEPSWIEPPYATKIAIHPAPSDRCARTVVEGRKDNGSWVHLHGCAMQNFVS